jgi:hypothetical protein
MNCNPNAVACQIELLRQSLDSPSVVQIVAAAGSLLAVVVAIWAAWRSNKLAREAQAREDRRVAAAAATADLAARFEAGRPDAVKALKLAEALLPLTLNPPPSDDPSLSSEPLIFENESAARLASRVRRLPISTVAERLRWLVDAAVNPRIFAPDPLLGIRFFQRQCLEYVADELRRFIRRDVDFDPAAEALARNIADRVDKWRNT